MDRRELSKDSCLEIGCGAGRLTRSIGSDFSTVYGVDVAEGMISYARQHVGGNVKLYVTDGVTLPIPDQSVKAVFSFIVFLHFDNHEHAEAYFREIARVLKPDGSIMIQLPLHQWPANLKPIVRKGFTRAHGAYMALRRTKARYHRFLLSRHKWSPFMQSITYDVDWVHEKLSALGFTGIETCAFPLHRGRTVYSWVFARKALQK
jgi:ubiquinone/menaquinone biosynthesis C-methylase UbiE